MSAPTVTRPTTRKRVSVEWQKVPAQRGAVRIPSQRTQAALAKRDERLRRSTGAPRKARAAVTQNGRPQFVLLIMGLFATGLVLTLWLSTAAAADSYTLGEARTAARDLTEQSERLHREVAGLEAAPALAQRAADLGMVPVQDPARLVVAPDGGVTVVGEPTAAVATAAPATSTNPMPAVATGPSQTAADAAAQAPADGAATDPATDPAADPAAQQAQPDQGEAASQQQAQADADRAAAENPQQPGGA